MATEGAVHENYAYYVELLSEVDLGSISLHISVNGDEPERCVAPRSPSTMTWGGMSYWYYRCDLGDTGWKLFKSSYGFAVVEVRIIFADGRPTWTLYTKDIPCVCPFQDQEQAVSEMIDALSSTKSDLASKWMFSGISPDAPSSALVDGGLVADSSQTLSGYLEFVDRVANSYEENLSYFRVKAHSRTLKREEVVNTAYARKLGRRELIWMSRNAESMHRVERETGLRVNGSYYMATEVQTERSMKSFDNDENRAVLAFIKEISSSLRSVSDRVEVEVARLESMQARLSAINSGEGMLLSRAIIEACIKREAPLAAKAEVLRRRCQGLVIAYERALPGVSAVRYRKPRRSKVFQEVRPYADVFSLMRIWPEFEGFDLVRDGLLLHTFKVDKLYEYFALLRILEWFAEAGFVEDAKQDRPIVSFRYTHRGRFSNETQVANLYRLVRGDLSVSLYYQPVIYGDSREENGITLHRVSTTAPFSKDGRDSVWTPDFLIVLEGGRFDAKKHIVLDAKFRPVNSLKTNTWGEKGEYAACSFKYKTSIASSGQERVDALWLLCGKTTEPESYLFQESSWAMAGGVAMRDGIAALSPSASALDDMFAEMGIEKAPPIAVSADAADLLPEQQAEAEDEIGGFEHATTSALVEEDATFDSAPVVLDGAGDETEGRHSVPSVDSQHSPTAFGEGSLQSDSGSPKEDGPETPHEEPATVGEAGRAPGKAEQHLEKAEMSTDEAQPRPANEEGEAQRAPDIEPDVEAAVGHGDCERAVEAPIPDGFDARHGRSAQETPPAKAEDSAAVLEEAPLQSPVQRKKSPSQGLNDDVLDLVGRMASLIFDKKSLYDAAFSQKSFGFQYPLLKPTAPVGRAAKLYTRELIDVGEERCHVYSAWRPINVQKLKNFVRALEKTSRETVSTPEVSVSAEKAVETNDLKRDKSRKRAQLPDDSPLREEISRSYQRVSSEWLQEKNKGVSFEEYSSGKKAGMWPAWWQGKCGHKWRARLSERLVDPLCPACLAKLKARDKRAAKLFHRTKNGNDLLAVIASGSTDKSCWWRCSKNHDWRESLDSLRGRDCACPECPRGDEA